MTKMLEDDFVDRREKLNPQVVMAIQTAVLRAFDQNPHKCLLGMESTDKKGFLELKSLLEEYPTVKLRESFHLMGVLVKARNVAGNVFMSIVFLGIFGWMLSKLFPGIWSK